MKNSKSRIKHRQIADPLAIAANKAGLSLEKLRSVRRWLTEQLVAYEYAKLSEGGHKENQVPLRRVFVDLPVTTNPNTLTHRDSSPLFLQRLLHSQPIDIRRSLRVKSEKSLNEHAATESDDGRESEAYSDSEGEAKSRHRPAANLLIGGPGQGKSTLGQLICQLHRVSLIRPTLDDLSQGQKDLIQTFDRENPSNDPVSHLVIPENPFLPIQVSLPDFAAWIGSTPASSQTSNIPLLLEFVASLPSAQLAGLKGQTLLELLESLPALLVLDGFDEVGSTQDRRRIVEASRELLLSLSQKNGYAQVLATTRPQGYADELADVGIRFQKLYLSPLQTDEALQYADKLIEAKISGADNQQRAFQQIREAAKEPATQRLLTTPLQVTIMAALIQQMGRAPRERWNLFQRYFSTIYDREIERRTYASTLLSDHRSHIERIHARVALLLQVEAERQGGASARMPRERLEEVINAVLEEDEVSEEKRRSLVIDISQAAELRLVFLVEPEPGKFGFEIRSLQEFMAAWALGSGRDVEVEARLHQVAKAPMFKNVTLFVASRLFSEASPLRDVLADRICSALDSDITDRAASTAKSGALLALDTLDEGAALTQPKRARALMQRAIAILYLPAGIEHLRLVRAADEDTIGVLSASLNDALSANSDSRYCGTSAWLCVIDATNRGQQWAIELGERHWNESILDSRLFVALARNQVALGTWITRKIEQNASPSSLAELIEVSVNGREHQWAEKGSWLGWILSTISSYWGYRGKNGINGVEGSPRATRSYPTPDYSRPSGLHWDLWLAICSYEEEPNASHLSAALAAVNKLKTKQPFEAIDWLLSWPLSACLVFAQDEKKIKKICTALNSGKLGDTADWIAAERKWRATSSPNINPSKIPSGLPWDLASLSENPPVVAYPHWRLIEWFRAKTRRGLSAELLAAWNVIFASADSPALKQRAADICLGIWRHLPASANPKNIDPRLWVSVSRAGASSLLPRPRHVSIAAWIDLLNAADNLDTIPYFLTNEEIAKATSEAPNNPVLLRLIVRYLTLYGDHPSRDEIMDMAALAKTTEYFGPFSALPATFKADYGLLLILLGSSPPDLDGEIFSAVEKEAEDRPSVWPSFFAILRMAKISSARREQFLLAAYNRLGNSSDESYRALRQIRDVLQKRSSDLDNHSTWDRLALPFPYPKPPLAPRISGGIPSTPVQIKSLQLHNVCGVGRLSLKLSESPLNEGQWLIVIGPNGSGKTTILRSLALALRNIKDPSIWPKGSFTIPWLKMGGERALAQESIISVGLNDGAVHRTVLRSGSPLSISQFPEHTSPSLFPLFAYGCRRGSALGGHARQVNIDDDSGPEISTLFDEGSDLIQAETWIISLEGDTQKSPQSALIYDSLVRGLCTLLNVSRIFVENQRLWAIDPEGVTVPFASLSDGYLTQAGWFLDLVARWLDLAKQNNFTLNKDFLGEMTGLVLIDEIDLHLHPLWQTEIISRTRDILPKMSFIATTHNPLTLVGARAEEIVVLKRSGEDVTATIGATNPMLLSGGQIYKQYFGISDIFPSELGRKLQRYGYLSGHAMRSDAEDIELHSLLRELVSHGVDPGWEITPRAESPAAQ